MNGATAELSVKRTRRLNSTKITMIGASQYLFLTLKKSQNSINIETFDMFPPLKLPCVVIFYEIGLVFTDPMRMGITVDLLTKQIFSH